MLCVAHVSPNGLLANGAYLLVSLGKMYQMVADYKPTLHALQIDDASLARMCQIGADHKPTLHTPHVVDTRWM